MARRRSCLLLLGTALAGAAVRAQGPSASNAPPTPSAAKVLRIASPSETGFDPARAGDIPSLLVISHLFEPLLGFDPLARPVKLRPRTAAAMPESSADYRTWTVKVQPGIFFTDHPAFQGRRRELTAADYVYSIKRLADPAHKSTAWSGLEQTGITGLAAARRQALEQKKPFDYDRPVEGLVALDRYTIRFQLGRPASSWKRIV